jgi:hypothetical protein
VFLARHFLAAHNERYQKRFAFSSLNFPTLLALAGHKLIFDITAEEEIEGGTLRS